MVEIGIILEFYSPIVGALMGSVSAFVLTRYLMMKKYNDELKKVKNIINDEFYRLHYYANESIETIMEKIKNYKEFHSHILEISYEISRGRSPLLLNLPHLRFLLWDSITSSGKMMELETDEIQLINAAHENIEYHFQSIGHTIEQFEQEISHIEEDSIEYLKICTHAFYGKLKLHFYGIVHQFNVLDKKIDWIKNDFSSETFKKINEEFADYPQGILSSLPVPNEEFEKKSPI